MQYLRQRPILRTRHILATLPATALNTGSGLTDRLGRGWMLNMLGKKALQVPFPQMKEKTSSSLLQGREKGIDMY